MANESIILNCPKCGAKNRVPQAKINDRPVCGKCKYPLSGSISSGVPLDITDNSFDNEVLAFNGPVLVDCWAPWCGPCRMVGPIYDKLSEVYDGRFKFCKINVDENQVTAANYQVMSIPTQMFFHKGKKVDEILGAVPESVIREKVDSMLKTP